jgi:hypothetical protein
MCEANLQQFPINFYRDEADEAVIHFPRPVEGWISHNVLVEELFEAGPVDCRFIRDRSVSEDTRCARELAGPSCEPFSRWSFSTILCGCGNVLVLESTVPAQPTPLSSSW